MNAYDTFSLEPEVSRWIDLTSAPNFSYRLKRPEILAERGQLRVAFTFILQLQTLLLVKDSTTRV